MEPKEQTNAPGLSATDWEPLFRKAGVEIEKLDAAKSKKAMETLLGNWLARNADREVAITVGKRTGKARLRIHKGRAKRKSYVFEICWDEIAGAESQRDQKSQELERPPGSKPRKVSGLKKKVKKARRKNEMTTNKKPDVTDKVSERPRATGKKTKVVAKKKARRPKKNVEKTGSGSDKHPSGQDQQQGNSESW